MSATAVSALALHRLVWDDNADGLRDALQHQQHDLEAKDAFGRSPLRLAIVLGRRACAKALLDSGADATGADEEGWTAVHEATATGDQDLLKLILEDRNYRLRAATEDRIPQLLELLRESEDFSVEMQWEFSSWLPFVSRMAPSDTYRIWKKGSSVRVDTTLVGFENMKWIRGRRSFIFKCVEGAHPPQFEMLQVDHENQVVFCERSGVAEATSSGGGGPVSRNEVRTRLNNPVTSTSMDSDKIGFSRVKSGFWGFQSDKTEEVGGFKCEVYDASGIEVVTRTRLEHLPEHHPARKKERSPFSQAFTSMTGGDEAAAQSVSGSLLESVDETEMDEEDEEGDPLLDGGEVASGSVARHPGNSARPTVARTVLVSPGKDSFDDYQRLASSVMAGHGSPLSRRKALQRVVLGRPRQMRTKVQKFKARLSMSRDFPLSLPTQVLPIIDLLAPTSQHISKLRDFMSLQLPTGFPVKIEIPVYHVLTARVTFGAYERGCKDDDDGLIFSVPEGYRVLDSEDAASGAGLGDEDAMLLLALQQSMHAQDTFDFADGGMVYGDDELQRALMESLVTAGLAAPVAAPLPAIPPSTTTSTAEAWSCAACTFENPPSFLACEICGTQRPRAFDSSAPTGRPRPAPVPADDDEELRLALQLSMSDK